ncbi:hypothetical protein H4S08_002830, partial [Coemansia sp. RSA 1365]
MGEICFGNTSSNDENAPPLSQVQGSETEHMFNTDRHFLQTDIRYMPRPLANRWGQLTKKWFTESQQFSQQNQTLKVELAVTHEAVLKHKQ